MDQTDQLGTDQRAAARAMRRAMLGDAYVDGQAPTGPDDRAGQEFQDPGSPPGAR